MCPPCAQQEYTIWFPMRAFPPRRCAIGRRRAHLASTVGEHSCHVQTAQPTTPSSCHLLAVERATMSSSQTAMKNSLYNPLQNTATRACRLLPHDATPGDPATEYTISRRPIFHDIVPNLVEQKFLTTRSPLLIRPTVAISLQQHTDFLIPKNVVA